MDHFRMLLLKAALAGRTHRSKILVITDIYVGASYLETTILAERCEEAKHQQTLPALFKRNASVVIRPSHRYGPPNKVPASCVVMLSGICSRSCVKVLAPSLFSFLSYCIPLKRESRPKTVQLGTVAVRKCCKKLQTG